MVTMAIAQSLLPRMRTPSRRAPGWPTSLADHGQHRGAHQQADDDGVGEVAGPRPVLDEAVDPRHDQAGRAEGGEQAAVVEAEVADPEVVLAGRREHGEVGAVVEPEHEDDDEDERPAGVAAAELVERRDHERLPDELDEQRPLAADAVGERAGEDAAAGVADGQHDDGEEGERAERVLAEVGGHADEREAGGRAEEVHREEEPELRGAQHLAPGELGAGGAGAPLPRRTAAARGGPPAGCARESASTPTTTQVMTPRAIIVSDTPFSTTPVGAGASRRGPGARR